MCLKEYEVPIKKPHVFSEVLIDFHWLLPPAPSAFNT